MKRLLVEDGIRTSLASIFSGAQDIYEGNFEEIVKTLYTPGFFIRKDPNTGIYSDDFKPVISTKTINNVTLPVLEINVGAPDGISEVYMDGKILSLNAKYILDVFSTSLINVNIEGTNTEVNVDVSTGVIGSGNTDTDYYVWVVPKIDDTQVVDYLPNYKVEGQTKKLVRIYSVGFLLTKVSATTGNPAVGIKLCKITVNGSTKTITNLVDLRLLNRAYLRSELYDFFTASFLKQKFIISNIGKSPTNSSLSLSSATAGTPHALNGKIELIGSKMSMCRIIVEFTNFQINITDGLGTVVYVTVSPDEFFETVVLTKTPEKSSITDFNPTEDKIVIGVHRKVEIPTTGLPSGEDS